MGRFDVVVFAVFAAAVAVVVVVVASSNAIHLLQCLLEATITLATDDSPSQCHR